MTYHRGVSPAGFGAAIPARLEDELLNSFSALVFTSKTDFQKSQVAETRGKNWTKKVLPLVEEHQVREYLRKLDIHEYMDPDRMHSKVLWELADIIVGHFQ